MTTTDNGSGAVRSVLIRGEPFGELPEDLYIPPGALEVFLETFEGPLDLLLYLIRKDNFDILDIPIARVTEQYLGYIDLLKEAKLELAAEYLVMAAMLAEIKSRMLLPRPPPEEDEGEDPRAQLVRRLQQYEVYRAAAGQIEARPRLERELFIAIADPPQPPARPDPPVRLDEIITALGNVLARADVLRHHTVRRDALSVRERMGEIMSRLTTERFLPFESCFDPAEGRGGVVVTFVALLELVKESLLVVVQTEAFAPIYLKTVSGNG
ncbi:MAG: segregation and condensation protein A [Acidiferrobacteraceae bacterium]